MEYCLAVRVITESLAEMAEELDFPQQRGGTVLLYLETMFSVAMIENQILTSVSHNHSTDSYQLRLLNILLLVLKYHFPQSYYRIPKEAAATGITRSRMSL